MSLAVPQPVQTAWIASDEPAVLERIHEEAVHLVLWKRSRPQGLDWLNTLDFEEIDDLQESLAVAQPPAVLAAALENAGYPPSVRAAVLAAEITALARRFARIMKTETVRLRLEVVETDACRKFHMDNVTARLITPLTEPGTQWIEADGGPDTPVNHLHAGEVGLFKGRIWAEMPAILHRSPPIAGSGLSRLLLVLDMPARAADRGETS